jgi:hypothetical protein
LEQGLGLGLVQGLFSELPTDHVRLQIWSRVLYTDAQNPLEQRAQLESEYVLQRV